MTFAEFTAKQFPEKSVFDRKQFDFITNLVKWVALRLSYILYKSRITANLLDVMTLILALAGFFLLSTAMKGEKLLPLIGILFIYFHVFIDFVDGPIAKASNRCSKIGHLFDDLGCNVDRLAMIILLGIFTGNIYIVLGNVFAAGIFVMFVPLTRREMPEQGFVSNLKNLICNKYSFLSVRFMLAVLPLFLASTILFQWNLQKISFVLSIFYLSLAFIWLLLCIPYYEPVKKD